MATLTRPAKGPRLGIAPRNHRNNQMRRSGVRQLRIVPRRAVNHRTYRLRRSIRREEEHSLGCSSLLKPPHKGSSYSAAAIPAAMPQPTRLKDQPEGFHDQEDRLRSLEPSGGHESRTRLVPRRDCAGKDEWLAQASDEDIKYPVARASAPEQQVYV